MTNRNNDDDKKSDLTRLEDISEFIHVEDTSVNNMFGSFETETTIPLKQEDESELIIEETEIAETEEITFSDETIPNLSFSDDNEASLFNFYETEDSVPEFQEEFQDIVEEVKEDEAEVEIEVEVEVENETLYPPIPPEKFEEVNNFAQNFSYGHIQEGGNPPFSLVIRNLKYTNDAEDILIILKDLGLITNDNISNIETGLKYGSLLIPQISEYSAIILAHKFRRFDCDIEVGLSDEVHPSKSGESNPRGLVKKEGILQNIVEKFHVAENKNTIQDIIISTTSNIEGYIIKKYLGSLSSFAIVDEKELERLKFVQQSIRAKSTIENYLSEDDSSNLTSVQAFNDFQTSFELLFSDLSDQLKTKAIKENANANALLGLNYQLSAVPLKENSYHIICTATLAIIESDSDPIG